MINWPKTLVQEITARRCILFLGAGVSSSCKSSDGRRPKGWGEFISEASQLIGCSLDDPDIQLILEDINIIGSGNRPHYILIREKQQNVYGLSDWRETYNIRALEYGPSHDDLVTDLDNLLEQVNYKRSIQGNG